jgi:hypothetical protein
MEQGKIEVVRYIRPTVTMTHQTNLYGITVIYEIDYDTRTVRASWAICEGENFSKTIGYAYANARQQEGKVIVFNFDTIDDFAGLSNTLRESIAATLGLLSPREYARYFGWDFSDDLFLFKEGLKFCNKGVQDVAN